MELEGTEEAPDPFAAGVSGAGGPEGRGPNPAPDEPGTGAGIAGPNGAGGAEGRGGSAGPEEPLLEAVGVPPPGAGGVARAVALGAAAAAGDGAGEGTWNPNVQRGQVVIVPANRA